MLKNHSDTYVAKSRDTCTNDVTIIRVATVADARALLDIYKPYVQESAITFEWDVPTETEFALRITEILQHHPYLVAQRNGDIVGYAYTGSFVGRQAYDWSVETTVYLRLDERRHGLGRRIYQVLEDVSRMQGITDLYACIAVPELDDEYLNHNSVEFHAHLGYKLIGRFHKCGYKFGRWYDMVWMGKNIAHHPDIPNPVIPFSDLADDKLAAAGVQVSF